MALSKKPVTGMKDILPAEMQIRDYVIGVIKETYAQFGFTNIETPCVENIANLSNKQGGENEKLILYQTLDSSIETIMGNINDYEMMYVENVEIISVEKNGRRFYFWSFEGYDFEFSGSLAISEEEFLKMIQNLLKERD